MTPHEGIRQLLTSYDDAVIRRDAEQWGSNWIDDAVWILWDGERRGRQRIVDDWVALMDSFRYVDFRTRIGHVDFTDQGANARCYTTDLLVHADERVEQVHGVYFDQYVDIDNRWLFARREYHILMRATLSVSDLEYAKAFPAASQ